MRKFFTIILAAITMLFAASCTSCNNDAKFGIEYDLAVTGNTDAAVTVEFTGGHFGVDGAANFDFGWTNVTEAVNLRGVQSYVLDEALASNDARVADAAARVNEWVDGAVAVDAFTGHYDIYIKGYVKETLTGLTFEIDRRITNVPVDAAEDQAK